MDRVEGHFAGRRLPSEHPWGAGATPPPDELTVAFWCACDGGQLQVAEYLAAQGADIEWVAVWDGLTPLDAARREGGDELVDWLRARGARSADERHDRHIPRP